MKKALTLVSAAALATAMVAPASAENLPLNKLVGGKGEEKVQGQGAGTLAVGAGFVAAVAVVAIVAATAGDDSDVTVSTTP